MPAVLIILGAQVPIYKAVAFQALYIDRVGVVESRLQMGVGYVSAVDSRVVPEALAEMAVDGAPWPAVLADGTPLLVDKHLNSARAQRPAVHQSEVPWNGENKSASKLKETPKEVHKNISRESLSCFCSRIFKTHVYREILQGSCNGDNRSASKLKRPRSHRTRSTLQQACMHGSVHTSCCKQHQRFSCKFACKSACASCVNEAKETPIVVPKKHSRESLSSLNPEF